MHIAIPGAESLGVRGLCCVVEVEDRRIVIDPGLALGYWRCGPLPHPTQVAVGEQVCRGIVTALKEATDEGNRRMGLFEVKSFGEGERPYVG